MNRLLAAKIQKIVMFRSMAQVLKAVLVAFAVKMVKHAQIQWRVLLRILMEVILSVSLDGAKRAFQRSQQLWILLRISIITAKIRMECGLTNLAQCL
jgi:hypothetical protein